MGRWLFPISARNGIGTHDLERDLALAEPHGTPSLAVHGTAVRLSGYAALALAQDVIDGGGDRRQGIGGFPVRHQGMKTAGKFLGDETGGQLPRPPTRMLHQGGKK